MPKIIEYCVLTLDLTEEKNNNAQSRLTDLGAQGWELVAVNGVEEWEVTLYLKRTT